MRRGGPEVATPSGFKLQTRTRPLCSCDAFAAVGNAFLSRLLSMGKRQNRHATPTTEGYARITRGRERRRSKSRPAGGARDSTPAARRRSQSRTSQRHGERRLRPGEWDCWKCGEIRKGIGNCTKCNRAPPAWLDRQLTSGGGGPHTRSKQERKERADQSQALAKLQKECDRMRAQHASDIRALKAVVAHAPEAPVHSSQESEADDIKVNLRKELVELRLRISRAEALDDPAMVGVIKGHKEHAARIQLQLVEGQPINQRVRNLELAISRKDKARELMGRDMFALEEERARIVSEMDAKQREYKELLGDIRQCQAERAELLSKQAAEAGAALPVGSAVPPPPAANPAQPSLEQCLVVLKGVFDELSASDAERALVETFGQRAIQRRQAVETVPNIPVPTSPRLQPNPGDGGTPPEPPAAEPPASIPSAQPTPPTQELVGDAAASGRDEFATPADADVQMEGSGRPGSIFDREPPSLERAMADEKRRRIIKK